MPRPARALWITRAYARRRHLGPYRAPDARDGRRERDLASLARAGFGFDIARRVVDAPSVEDLEAAVLGEHGAA